MKISLSLAFFTAFALFGSSSGGQVQVLEDFFDAEECENFRQASADVDLMENYNGRRQGVADLPLAIARRMHEALGKKDCVSFDDDKIPVVTSLISKTTTVHKDHHRDGHLAAEQVGFVFLNDNEDASFVHGNEQVPVRSGNMVAFQGDIPHNTVVRSGNVQLLGPFALSSFQPVGEPSESICEQEDCIDCGCCPDENGFPGGEFVCECEKPRPKGGRRLERTNERRTKGGEECSAREGIMSFCPFVPSLRRDRRRRNAAKATGNISRKDLEDKVAAYEEKIKAMDEKIGRLLLTFVPDELRKEFE